MKKRVSSIKEYSGYSEEIFDGYKLTSQYLTMRDGVKLAIDIYRPTKGGELHTEKLPVLWTATQYRRAVLENGKRPLMTDGILSTPPGIETILRHGYVIAGLDVRGSGASFGNRSMLTTADEAYDLYEVNEWLARQDWCDGQTGMFGISYLGMTQLTCAQMMPPSLKCIVPNCSPWEMPTNSNNGIVNICQYTMMDEIMYACCVSMPAVPVDEDVDGSMLKAAVEQHESNPSSVEERAAAPYLDSLIPSNNRKVYLETYLPYYLNNLNNSGIAIYVWGSFKDLSNGIDEIMLYNSLKCPKKLLMGNWYHPGSIRNNEADWTTEHLRWFDYWLKGIENGIMDEPPIYLCRTRVPKDLTVDFNPRHLAHDGDFVSLRETHEWNYYDQWPDPGTKHTEFYFTGVYSGTVKSVNDGTLCPRTSDEGFGEDEYKIDYSVSKEKLIDRMSYMVATSSQDYTPFDEKSLTYTTAPMVEDTELAGFPVAHLWISSPVKNLDFYVTLEEIDENNVSHYLADGKMRASIRATIDPPYNYLGLPYHRNYIRDQKDLPLNTPVKLDLTMFPLLNMVEKGHRLRVTINNCDKGRWDTPELSPAPTIRLYHTEDLASGISLPVMKNR